MKRLDAIKTITVLSIAVLIAYLISGAKWLIWVALLLLVGSAFESPVTTAIARYWMRLASFLGKINSKVMLTIMFFVILTPIALLYRPFNREKVDHFLKNRRLSYFDDVRKSYGREDFEKPW